MASTLGQASVVTWLIAWRWPLLGLAVCLAAVALGPSQSLRFDRSIENMFAPDDPVLEPYRLLKRTFGASEMVLATYDDEQLMSPAGLARLATVEEQIKQIPGVAAVLSLRSPMGDKILDEDSLIAEKFLHLFAGYTHSADRLTAALVVQLTPISATTAAHADTVRLLRDVVDPLPQGAMTGEPVMVVDGFRYIEEDGQWLGRASTVLLGVTIILCFRSLRWLLIPIAVVQLTLVLTRALLVWLDLPLSMVSSMLTAIVTVVGVATVIHLIVRFRDARGEGLGPREALQQAGTQLAMPIAWACATDAAGFASLLVAGVGPIQDFGLMMALGALLVIVSVALLVPGLALAGRVDADPHRAWGEDRLDSSLRRLLDWVERRPKTVGAITLLVGGSLAAGIFRIEVETDFTKNFRPGSPIVKAYEQVETRMGGAAVWDIVLPAPDRLDWSYLAKVGQLEALLRRDAPGLTKVLSIVDGVRAGAPIDPPRIRSALLRRAAVRAALRTLNARMPEFYKALYNQDPDVPGKFYYRIMLRSRERQSSAEKQALIATVDRIARERFPEARVTGYFVLLTNLIHSVIRDQWLTFGVASAAIGLMMLLAFRSPLVALVALVPNALPILMVTGLLGWLGVKINMGAAMIAAVSMGLSIDSSIHYIAAFRRARQRGLGCRAALDEVQLTAGRALVFATGALVVGFSSLAFSQFVPTVYFGVLVSLAMLGGLAGNLIVLPLLLQLVTRR
jgi:predicted RND superfamily exporter protein